MNLIKLLMKTYTISENLYKAILESVYHKGICSTHLDDSQKKVDEKNVIISAFAALVDQQYIYEN